MPSRISKEAFDCPVVKQAVNVMILTVALHGQTLSHSPAVPAAIAKSMKGCDCAHICGKFPPPAHLAMTGKTGCPYHDNLNKG